MKNYEAMLVIFIVLFRKEVVLQSSSIEPKNEHNYGLLAMKSYEKEENTHSNSIISYQRNSNPRKRLLTIRLLEENVNQEQKKQLEKQGKTENYEESTFYTIFKFLVLVIVFIKVEVMFLISHAFLSIDELQLELKGTIVAEDDRQKYDMLVELFKDKNRLSFSMLFVNYFFLSLVPIEISYLLPRPLAATLASFIIVVLLEIIPCYYFNRRDKLSFACKWINYVKIICTIVFPVRVILSLIYTRFVDQNDTYRSRLRTDLKEIIYQHTYNSIEEINQREKEKEKEAQRDDKNSDEKALGFFSSNHQVDLMKSALEITHLQAFSLMIPMNKLFMISYDEPIDKFKLQLILEKGYSRIPVFKKNNKNNIIGILRIKNLIGVDISQNKSLKQISIPLRPPIVLPPTLNLVDLLKELRKGKSHLAIITEQVKELQQKLGLNRRNSVIAKEKTSDYFFASNKSRSEKKLVEVEDNIKILGIVTLEDVLEKIMNLDIMDEDDYDEANASKTKIFENSAGNSHIFLINTLLSKQLTQALIKKESGRINTLLNMSYKKTSLSESFDSNTEMTNKAGFESKMKEKLLD